MSESPAWYAKAGRWYVKQIEDRRSAILKWLLGLALPGITALLVATLAGLTQGWGLMEWTVGALLAAWWGTTAYLLGAFLRSGKIADEAKSALEEQEEVLADYGGNVVCELTRSAVTKRPIAVHGFLCNQTEDGAPCRSRLASSMTDGEGIWFCEDRHRIAMPHHSAQTSAAVQALDEEWRRSQRVGEPL